MLNPPSSIKPRKSRKQKCRIRRDGATAVEFALVAPIIFLFVLSAPVFSSVLMNQHTLTAAARAGGRTASLSHVVSQQEVIDVVNQRLELGNIDPESVDVVVSPANLSGIESGDEISIQVSMPMNLNTWFACGGLLSDKNLVTTMTYHRE